MTTPQAVEQSYWDASYREYQLRYDSKTVLFKDLFSRFLPSGGDCLEIGCFPGNNLLYLCRTFGYRAFGVDLTPDVRRLPGFFQQEGVEVGSFEQADFQTWQPGRVYDVVCSFGFIEHFYNYADILLKHIDLVAPGGWLILSCPNFRGLQRFLHQALDQENLQRHVLAAMDLHQWRLILQSNAMTPAYHGYYQTADFWIDSPLPHRWQRGTARRITRLFGWLNAHSNIPNPLLSPYIVSVSRKAQAPRS